MQNKLLAAAMGLNGVEYITAGETNNPRQGRQVAFLLPVGGVATLGGITGADPSVPVNLVLLEGASYPMPCETVTLDAGSDGALLVYYL